MTLLIAVIYSNSGGSRICSERGSDESGFAVQPFFSFCNENRWLSMTQPLSIATILAEFKEKDKAWVLKDIEVCKYVMFPDPDYSSRPVIHVFLDRAQAEHVLKELRKANLKLRYRKIVAQEVELLEACKRIAADKTPGNAEHFVVHSYNEF
jgi:hypothetical protein